MIIPNNGGYVHTAYDVSFRRSLNLNIFGVFENVLEKKAMIYSADYKKVRGHARF